MPVRPAHDISIPNTLESSEQRRVRGRVITAPSAHCAVRGLRMTRCTNLQFLYLITQHERLVVAIHAVAGELHRRCVDVIGEAQVDIANGLFVDGETLCGQLAFEREEAL